MSKSAYHFPNPGGDELDFYAVRDALREGKEGRIGDGAIDHAFKKLFCVGMRSGGKGRIQDITEARDSLNRALEQITTIV